MVAATKKNPRKKYPRQKYPTDAVDMSDADRGWSMSDKDKYYRGSFIEEFSGMTALK
jgi:hypothetical protein